MSTSPVRISGRIVLEMPHKVTRVPAPLLGASLRLTLERDGTVAIVPDDVTSNYTRTNYTRQVDLEVELKSLRETLLFAGVTNFHGSITRVVEDGSAAERYSFAQDSHELVIDRAQLRWPDGTPVEIS